MANVYIILEVKDLFMLFGKLKANVSSFGFLPGGKNSQIKRVDKCSV